MTPNMLGRSASLKKLGRHTRCGSRDNVGAITKISFGTQIGKNMINDVKNGTGLTRQRRQKPGGITAQRKGRPFRCRQQSIVANNSIIKRDNCAASRRQIRTGRAGDYYALTLGIYIPSYIFIHSKFIKTWNIHAAPLTVFEMPFQHS